MEISSPDYRNLINATANNASVNSMIAAQRASEAKATGDFVMNLFETGMKLGAQVISTQDQAQQASLKPELEQKGAVYNQLLNESIKKGTTYIGQDENGKMTVNYAPEVLEYRNTWLDDVSSRSELSPRTIEWANDVMDGIYNQSDEQVLYTIAANNASLASSDMDTQVRRAAVISANQGSTDYLVQTIEALPVSDQYKKAYMQEAFPIFEGEYQTLTANKLASTEGIEAAYKYINGLAVDSARKDTLKQGAYTEFQRSKTALIQTTQQSVEAMLEGGASWKEIHETLENADGYSAYERSLVREEITARQSTVVTNACAPYLAQVQSGTLSVDELEDIQKDLRLNKGMFAGGLEGTYETYNGILENAITARKQKDLTEGKTADSQALAQFKLQAENYYDMWNQGKISGDDALSQIRAIAEANPDDLNVVNAMNDFVNKIIDEKVPLRYRDYLKQKMSGFEKVYASNAKALGYQPMSDDAVANYEQLYKDTVNFISGNEDLTLEDIDKFIDAEADGFFARYADAKALEDASTPPAPVEIPTKDLKYSAETVYNQYDAGLISSSQALSYLNELEVMSASDPEALAKVSELVAKINTQNVPNAKKGIYESYVKTGGIFDKSWLRQAGVDKVDDLDDEGYVRYINNRSYFETAFADYISANTGANSSDLNKEAQRIMDSFSAPYATDDITLVWGTDTAGTKTQSFLDTLQSFKDTEPFVYSYNRATGKIEYEWVNEKAKSNWDNAGRYGLQALRESGYDVSDYEVFELGDNALPLMVFRSSDGKALYTINLDAPSSPNDPQVGDVSRVNIMSVGGMQYAEMRGTVTPSQSQQEGMARGAQTPSGAPRNYSFDTSSMDTGTGGDANFVTQERQKQEAADTAKAQERQARQEANEAIVAERSKPADETAEYYASELRSRGMDPDDARRLAPALREEIERLKKQGVSNRTLVEQAVNNIINKDRYENSTKR